MGADTIKDGSAPIENVCSGELEANIDSLEVILSDGDTTRELESAAEILTMVELDLTCSSEKLVNLDMLVMLVAARENDFEAFASVEEHTYEGSVEKALEFDLLYGFLDSEVRELGSFLSALQMEIVSSWGAISSCKQLGVASKEIQEKFRDCEESLKQSFEQVSNIKMQTANFRRILLTSSGDEKWKDDKELANFENGDLSNLNAKIKMQTAEQQRLVLRTLEKSLARELDLEKNLTVSRRTEEELRIRLRQRDVGMKEEAENIWERLFKAENMTEILLGISKELLERIDVVQFNLNGTVHREGALISELEDLKGQLKEKGCALQDSELSRTELMEKVNLLEQKLKEFESQLHGAKDSSEKNIEAEIISDELKEKAMEAEKRAKSAEAGCKLLRDSNMELNHDLSCLKTSISDATEKVELLERQLKDSEIKQLHAVALAEAGHEKQKLLDCTIRDMENLIKDLKSKAAKAEHQIDIAEEKCIILSESNADLIEETNFLRGRIECLEMSLHQADEAKKENAKDITGRTKLIADLVIQLAFERERLHQQISSITKYEDPYTKVKDFGLSENGSLDATSRKERKVEIVGPLATSYEIDNIPGDLLTNNIKIGHVDSTTKHDTVRNIDMMQLNFKYVLMTVIVLAIPAFAAFLYQQ